LSRSLNLSPSGAKLRTNARLKIGTPVQLEVVPPDGPSLRVGAIVWRVDADGLAFLFNSAIQHRLLRAS
jgi:PilZ domain-containing protein